jgi:pyruvate dehydrogenase (quinone)
MGCGLPYALAAKFAHPRRAVVALIGDGAMQMLGINALITIAQRWKDWADPRMAILVLNNGDLNMVTSEQRANAGERRFDDAQLLPAFPYADYAKLLGLRGLRVDQPDMVKPAWEEAFAADRPMVLEMVLDANVPPVPPHVSGKQVRSYIKALMSGDPEAMQVVKATAREWWAAARK